MRTVGSSAYRGSVPDAPTPGWIRRLARASMRHRGVAITALAASALGVSLDAIGPLLTRSAVDEAVAGSTATLVPIVVAILALALVRFAAAFLRRFMGGRLALDVQHDLRRQVFAAVQRLDGERQDALRTGQVVSRAITDLKLMQALLAIVPLSLGYVVLVVVVAGRDAVAVAAAHRRRARGRCRWRVDRGAQPQGAVPGDLVGPAAARPTSPQRVEERSPASAS